MASNDDFMLALASVVPGLSPRQISMESGGEQFWTSGPNKGKPKISSKGAVGVAQVMPETGPEAAAAAGLPWDRDKFYYDPGYNRQLGEAYQRKLETKYGDETLATAAYHQGPGNVDRALRLAKKNGGDWRDYIGPKGKAYIGYKGKGTPMSGNDSVVDAVANALNVPLTPYSVGDPKANEGSVQATAPQVDKVDLSSRADNTVTTSDRYSQFLQDAVTPITQNVNAQIERSAAVTGIKRNIVNDFAVREAALESKIKPLMAEREALAAKLLRIGDMNPLEQRFKAIFNPAEYDPRMIRGRLERVNQAVEIHEGNYKELNELRSGVAAASIDAETADQQTLELGRQSTLSQIQLLGQVTGAVKQNVGDHLFPLTAHVQTLQLEEATKQSLLGKLTLEKTVSLYQQAQGSPDGTVMMDGVKLSIGELQDAAQKAQGQDITFRNMVNAFKTSDLNTANAMESNYIDHMTPEQITEALKTGGKIKGADGTEYQLSITHLTQALESASQLRDRKVETTINATAIGLADSTLRGLSTNINATKARAIDMFGTNPGEFSTMQSQIQATYQSWRHGFDALQNDEGARAKYVAETMPQIQAMNQAYDTTITKIANKWGGSKAELSAVAENYLRGNPISGDAALKGLAILARSGMPAGSELKGPAAQAFAVARATVQEWDHPQAGDSIESLLKGGTKKESDLLRLLQQRVSSVYADGVADSVINDLPQLARSVRDPNNPGRLHPFARVSKEDFLMAVRHGDASAYEVIGQKLGIDPQKTKRIFSSGTDSPEWQELAKAKGLNNGSFADFYQQLQATQMSETLAALDASHSATPGFSPAKAYTDFLQTPEVQNKVNQSVQSYGGSSFGSYLMSSSAGGGFKDAWDNYTGAISAVYLQQNSKNLRESIKRNRTMLGDPWVRVNAVNRAAGLTPQESQVLLQAVKPLVSLGNTTFDERAMPGIGNVNVERNFDTIAGVIRNHKFDDPTIEKLRKKVDNQWDAMDAMVGTVFDSVSD